MDRPTLVSSRLMSLILHQYLGLLVTFSGILPLVDSTRNYVPNSPTWTKKNSNRPNILMIIIDDFRPQFEAMKGDFFPSSSFPRMVTPNIDKLASESALFRNAYAQVPLCGPSRASFLTGRRPDSTVQYTFKPYRVLGQNFTSIPQYFKEHGYKTYGIGKVFHRTRYRPTERMPVQDESEYAFSEQNFMIPDNFWNVQTEISWLGVDEEIRAVRKLRLLPDEMIRNKALSKLQDIGPAARKGDENFFLSVGFHKPHVPFIFPKEYLKLYNDIKLPSAKKLTKDLPEVAWFDYFDMRKRSDLVAAGVTGQYNSSIPDDITRDLRRAYYSAITYTDHLVGRVLSELERQGLANNTIVTLLSDHGYHLGENLLWGKELLTDLSTHTPLMFKIPGLTDKQRQNRDELVELVDIFPTLVDLAGLPRLDRCPEKDGRLVPVCHEGNSLMPLMLQSDPTQIYRPWKNAVFSQISRSNNANGIMGHSIRTSRYRYNAWVTVKYRLPSRFGFDWDNGMVAVELYDHVLDPEETVNVADNPRYGKVRAQLHGHLRAGWRSAVAG